MAKKAQNMREQLVLMEENQYSKKKGDLIYIRVRGQQPMEISSCRLQLRGINAITDSSPDRFYLGEQFKFGHIADKKLYAMADVSKFVLGIQPAKKSKKEKPPAQYFVCTVREHGKELWTFVAETLHLERKK